MKKWYRSWFNSPYYHILYSNRDYYEAERFIDAMYSYLKPTKNAKALDAACGRGRHSIYLNKKGLDVTGIDLSQQSIAYAKKFENDRLHFYEHDIRNLLVTNYFDYVFNLFTSFGYFKRDSEQIKSIRSFSRSLKPGGKLIIDFLNIHKIQENLNNHEHKCIDNINFMIEKKIEAGQIIKKIMFEDSGKHYEFKEEVKALSKEDFEKYCNLAGLTIVDYFGSYDLKPFNKDHSDRLIIIASKK